MEKIKPIIKILFLIGLGVAPFIISTNSDQWIMLFILLAFVWILKIPSAKSLFFTLIVFLLSSSLYLFGLNVISEFMFRLSLISLIIGICQAAFELNTKDQQHQNVI